MFPRTTQCLDCGVRLRFRDGQALDHECDENNLVNHQLTKLESSWRAFLESTYGQFEQFYAKRGRK